MKHLTEVRALKLSLPTEVGEEDEELYEDHEALQSVAAVLTRHRPTQIAGVVEVPENQTLEDKRVQEMIEALHREFDGTVLRDAIFPDPPIRGPHGEGHIEIKHGAVAKKQRPIRQVGERKQALVELVEKWVLEKKVEDGRGNGVARPL